MRFFCGVVFLISVGCGGDDVPASCDRDDREGTYYATFDERSGNCGPQTDAVVRIGRAQDPGCVLLDENWADNDCTYESTVVCELEDDDLLLEVTSTTTYRESGDLDGVMQLRVESYGTGQFICSSTYDMDAERQ